MTDLRTFMFDRVYLGPVATREHAKIHGVIGAPVRALLRPSRGDPRLDPRRRALPTRVTDYVAGMTDRYCITRFEQLERRRSPFAP